MHRLLWVLSVVLGVYFVLIGAQHFILPPGLPSTMAWMYELTATQHTVAGVAEILGGLGLILPGLLGRQKGLTPLAAAGLTLVMVLAAGWHLPRGEVVNIVTNVVLGALVAFIAVRRWEWRRAA